MNRLQTVALYLADIESSIEECYYVAKENVLNGNAKTKLKNLINLTNK